MTALCEDTTRLNGAVNRTVRPSPGAPAEVLDQGRAAEQRHQLEEPPEVEAAFAALAPGSPARRASLGVAA